MDGDSPKIYLDTSKIRKIGWNTKKTIRKVSKKQLSILIIISGYLNNMKIAIIGMWHLGTIISSGLSSLNKNKILYFRWKNIINNFRKYLPINEKNISSLIKKNYKKNLFFRSNLKEISQFNILWIAYDATIGINDKSDFQYTFSKIIKVLKCAKKNALIIVSTQIPIGTIKKLENYDKRKLKKNFRFIYIPENLRLGNGLEIFLKSPSTIIGLKII